MSEVLQQEIHASDFLILSPPETDIVFRDRDEYHDVIRELIITRRLYRKMQKLKEEGRTSEERLHHLVDLYSPFYPSLEKLPNGDINYSAVSENIEKFITEIINYFEVLISADVPRNHRYKAELMEDVKRDVIRLIDLAGRKGQGKLSGDGGFSSGSYQARLVLSKLIDWLNVNYKEEFSVEREMGMLEVFLNQSFFLHDEDNNNVSKLGNMEIVRFYDIDAFMTTVAYAVLLEDKERWVCYDKNGLKEVGENGNEVTLEMLRDRFKDQENVFEENTSRTVRYFANPYTKESERVYFHPRSKETPSISAKMNRQRTRDSDEIHDQKGIALTVENAYKVHLCETGLDKVWRVPGIRTDYTDTFHQKKKTLNVFTAPGMHIVKKRLLVPYKCELIIDTLVRNIDASESISLLNHNLYRYIQNMVKGVYKRMVPYVTFSEDEIRRWVRHKVLNLTPLNERLDVITDRYGHTKGYEKIHEIRTKTEQLLYDHIIRAVSVSNS